MKRPLSVSIYPPLLSPFWFEGQDRDAGIRLWAKESLLGTISRLGRGGRTRWSLDENLSRMAGVASPSFCLLSCPWPTEEWFAKMTAWRVKGAECSPEVPVSLTLCPCSPSLRSGISLGVDVVSLMPCYKPRCPASLSGGPGSLPSAPRPSWLGAEDPMARPGQLAGLGFSFWPPSCARPAAVCLCAAGR